MSALEPIKTKPFIESAGTEIYRDGADHPDGIKACQGLEILCDGQNDDRDGNSGDEWDVRHAVRIELGQRARHFAVLRHHVNDADHRDDGGVHGAEQQEAEDNANDDAQDVADSEPARHRPVNFREKAQHIFFVRSKLRKEISGQREHRPAEKSGADDHFNGDGHNRFCRRARDFWPRRGRARVEFHHAGDIRDGFHTAQRQDYAREGNPHVAQALLGRFQVERVQVGCAEDDDEHNDYHGRDRQPDRETPAMFRPKEIDDADGENQAHRGDRRVLARHAEIAYGRPPAERGGDREIRHEQERASRSEKAALFPRRGIHAAAIREMLADDNVIVGHHRGERADRENDRQRTEPRRDKGQADDVGFACSPIAVKQRRGAFPIHVARAMDGGGIEDRSGHCEFAAVSSRPQR